jgi:protein-S-isoprenylcysteine O-methyltransferase Ste14
MPAAATVALKRLAVSARRTAQQAREWRPSLVSVLWYRVSRIGVRRAIPAACFFFLVALQAELILHTLPGSRSFNGHAALLLASRVISLLFAAGIATIYVVRKAARRGRHNAVTFGVSMYASAALLAMQPIGQLTGLGGAASSDVQIIVADLLVFVGVAFAIYALLSLRLSFSIMPEARKLVTRGPYRFVRHPVYLGEIVAAVGVVLALPSALSLVVLVTYTAAQLVRTTWEEEILSTAFSEYSAYATRTARLVPGLF